MRNEPLEMVVVDDNPTLTSVLTEIFRECGHNVRAASNGFEALTAIRDRVPDLIVSDLCMPGMSGYELLSVVRRRFPTIRVIAMSGAHAGRDIPSGVAADAFYAKGVSSIAQLVQMVSLVWHMDTNSVRSATPICVPNISIDTDGSIALLISCPECLRPFSQPLAFLTHLSSTNTCPHCRALFEFLLVQQTVGTDSTPIAVRTSEVRRDRGSVSPRHAADVSIERMLQQ